MHLLDLPDHLIPSLLDFAGPVSASRLACVSKHYQHVCRDIPVQHVWRRWSMLRWGHHAGQDMEVSLQLLPTSAAAGAASTSTTPAATQSSAAPVAWSRYYVHRSSSWRAVSSPLALFQERVGLDPWRLIAGCCLTSRTGGGDAIRATLTAFHSAYPTPSHVVDAAVCDADALAALLKPLGLNRERFIGKTAAAFLDPEWGNCRVGVLRNDLAHDPSDLPGCAAYTRDSWRVFCHGQYRQVDREVGADKNVRAYASWAVREDTAGRLGSHPVAFEGAVQGPCAAPLTHAHVGATATSSSSATTGAAALAVTPAARAKASAAGSCRSSSGGAATGHGRHKEGSAQGDTAAARGGARRKKAKRE